MLPLLHFKQQTATIDTIISPILFRHICIGLIDIRGIHLSRIRLSCICISLTVGIRFVCCGVIVGSAISIVFCFWLGLRLRLFSRLGCRVGFELSEVISP